jgi:hypothetical protein
LNQNQDDRIESYSWMCSFRELNPIAKPLLKWCFGKNSNKER